MSERQAIFFHPLTLEWLNNVHGPATAIQQRAWEAVAKGGHVLLTAPTGSGKTLAAFLYALDRLATGKWSGGATRVLYVSPLKALNNDIRRNLFAPLRGLRQLYRRNGTPFQRIRVFTRSGDTSAAERRRMLRRPPEILITTPESLNLLLSSKSGRAVLTGLKTVILDEIHAVLASRRGTYLITAVERLTRLSGEFQRIACSATLRDPGAALRFLGGYTLQGSAAQPLYRPRDVKVINAPADKRYILAVHQPEKPEEMEDPRDFWEPYAECIKQHFLRNRSTLVFTSSRQLCEKLTYLINRDQHERLAYAHHGSLSREIRTAVERKLKSGVLKGIVATSSLELGIDIGALDEVVLVKSPSSAAETVQRIGRAGHGVGQISRATFYPAHALDCIHAAVLARAVIEGDIEEIHAIAAPLDVLAQIIVSMAAFEDWNPDELFQFIRTAAPYHDLSRRQFDLVLDMLAGRYQDRRIRELQPKIIHDRLSGKLQVRKGSLLTLYASGGVIPDRGYYRLRHAHSGARIGELDEEFVWEARVGQIFTLGTQNWRISSIGHHDVLAIPAPANRTAPPFWRAEETNRGFFLSDKIGRFLEAADRRAERPDFESELIESYHFRPDTARRLTDFLQRQQRHTGCALPHRHHLLVEWTTFGDGGAAGRQMVWHTFWGGQVNRPLALALEAVCKQRYGVSLEIFASNDSLVFPGPVDLSVQDLVALVTASNVDALIRSRLPQSGFFGARFRECAGRALLIPRQRINQRMPLWLSRLHAQKLMNAVASCQDFPVVVETWRTCLQDAFDMPALRRILIELETGDIMVSECHTNIPSPMARSSTFIPVNTFMYQSDAGMPDQAGSLSSDLIEEVALDPGLRPRLAPDLVRRFEAKRQRLEPGYAPQTALEILEWVRERVVLPHAEWRDLLAAAARDHGPRIEEAIQVLTGRLGLIDTPAVAKTAVEPLVAALDVIPRWVHSLYKGETPPVHCRLLDGSPCAAADASVAENTTDVQDPAAPDVLLSEWLRFYGPRPTAFIARTLGIPMERLQGLLGSLAASGTIVRGPLLQGGGSEDICDRENFETLLRLTRKTSRVDFQALPLTRLPHFLARYQGLTPAGSGAEDLAQRLQTLLCRPAPAVLWETEYLPARIRDYQPEDLDLILRESGLIWIGGPGQAIAFCQDDELDLMRGTPGSEKTPEAAAASDNQLFPDPDGRYPFAVLQESSSMGTAALNELLWQAVWRGDVSNDTFAALRRGIETNFTIPDSGADRMGAASRRRSGMRLSRGNFQQWRGSRPSIGNWFRVRYPGVAGDLLDNEDRNKDRVRLLMERFGVLFRELLIREVPELQWGSVFRSLRLMELSGEVLAGHFFEGIEGLQFIVPEALRLLKKGLPAGDIFWLNATDPVSLCGLGLSLLQPELPARLPGNHLVYHADRIVIVSMQHARHLHIHVSPDHPDLKQYLSFLRIWLTRRVTPRRSIGIETINNRPAALQEEYRNVLADLFEVAVDPRRLTLYRRHDHWREQGQT